MRILLNGACGKMGTTVKEVVRKSYPDIDIIPVDIITADGVFRIDDVRDFDCVIDFSSPDGFISAIKHALRFLKPFVSGTTGIGENEKRLMDDASKKIPVFYSPNMSIGVNICFKLVEAISRQIRCDVYISEVHHRQKKDKPSGTALRFKEIVEKNGLFVDIAALRAGDIVGEHEICFVMSGERIILKHTSLTREIFARGAVEVAKWIINQRHGLYSFSDMLKL